MTLSVVSQNGKELRPISLEASIFNCEVNQSAIYYAIRNELANRRQGTASTKTRGEVNGSRRKLWRQKGTGRARMGTRQSPIWVGGGVAFGPKPRDYSYRIPKKLKRLAFRSVLSLKTSAKVLTILEDIQLEEAKTKLLANILKGFVDNERTVLILTDSQSILKRAGRNIPWLTILSFDKLNVHDLFYSKKILVLESAANELNKFYGEK